MRLRTVQDSPPVLQPTTCVYGTIGYWCSSFPVQQGRIPLPTHEEANSMLRWMWAERGRAGRMILTNRNLWACGTVLVLVTTWAQRQGRFAPAGGHSSWSLYQVYNLSHSKVLQHGWEINHLVLYHYRDLHLYRHALSNDDVAFLSNLVPSARMFCTFVVQR